LSRIFIVGLGPAEDGLLTVNTLRALKEAKYLILRTSCHPISAFLKKENITFNSFDHIYEKSPDFEEVYVRICRQLLDLVKKHEEITYAVPGHPLVGEKTTLKLINACKKNDIDIEILPGLSFLDTIYSALMVDPLNGLQIVDALEISKQLFSPSLDLIVTQVYSRLIASDVKLQLLHYYPAEWQVTLVKSAGSEQGATLVPTSLFELDHYKEFDHLTSLYLPASGTLSKANFTHLVEIMARLRSPLGCPWDREQTHSSLKRHLIEESYEVVEAIDGDDSRHLMEELGDLMLQVIFHAQIAAEQGQFTIQDVIESITSKLIGRHPHIFGEEEAETPEDVVVHWEAAKKKEGKTAKLSAVPQSLPALLYAYKLQKKAARVGFDWEEKEDVLDKLSEEVKEFKKECREMENIDSLEDEAGDMLFSVVNICRHYGIEPESALRKTIKKFIRRFEHIEKEAEKRNKQLIDMSLQEKEILWQEAKELENSQAD